MLDHRRIHDFLETLGKASDDDELRHIFSTYHAEYNLDVPDDPHSQAYLKQQFDLYEVLAGKQYSSKNESTIFDVQTSAISPFPYCHESCETVGNQLMAIGFLIKTLRLKKKAKILEFGPGWGNTTIALAKMGFDVTVVDIEENFCNLISERAKLEKLDIKIINSDFDHIKVIDDQFDVVLFFECFHHAANHLDLMSAFDRVLKQNGLVCFGAEPITSDFPLPWGLRMDGESLWAISKNGWLELGYNRSYFDKTMGMFGWLTEYYRGSDSPWSSVILAKRKTEAFYSYSALDGKIRTQVGEIELDGSILTTNKSGYFAFGPYAYLPRGEWTASFIIDSLGRGIDEILVDVVCMNGTRILTSCPGQLVDNNGCSKISVEFSLDEFCPDLEVRMFVSKKTQLKLFRLEIHHI
jgi:ubiquinone/menaquinone biosynthesis C-methylase UbiE